MKQDGKVLRGNVVADFFSMMFFALIKFLATLLIMYAFSVVITLEFASISVIYEFMVSKTSESGVMRMFALMWFVVCLLPIDIIRPVTRPLPPKPAIPNHSGVLDGR